MPLLAIVFDVSESGFQDGVLDQSFDIDPDNPGDDIRIQFVRDTDAFQTFGGIQTPGLSSVLSDDPVGVEEAIAVIPDFASARERIRVRIDFLYEQGVTDVRIPIFDLDVGIDNGDGTFSFTDEIDRIRYREVGGIGTQNLNADDVVEFDPTTNAFDSGRNSIYGLVSTPNASEDGNVVIATGNLRLNRILFDYRNFPITTTDNPAIQGIGIGDIEYRGVPEPSLTALYLSLAVVLVCLTRRRYSSSGRNK